MDGNLSVEYVSIIAGVVGSFITGFWGFARMLVNRAMPKEEREMLEIAKENSKRMEYLTQFTVKEEEILRQILETNKDYVQNINRLIEKVMEK